MFVYLFVCLFVFVCTHHSGACAVSNARKPAATAEATAARVPPMSPAVPKPRSGSSTPFRSVTLPRIVGSASTACAIAGHGGSHVVFASFTHASSGAVAVSEAAEHDMTSKARAVKRTISSERRQQVESSSGSFFSDGYSLKKD